MEILLKEYASDSSDDEDFPSRDCYSHDDTKTDATDRLAEQVEDRRDKKVAEIADLDAADKEKGESTFDFFGLFNVGSDEVDKKEEDNTKVISGRVENVSVEGKVLPVEIPESEFWTDVKASELQTLQNRKFENENLTRTVQSANQRKRNFTNAQHQNKGFSNLGGSTVKLKHSNAFENPKSQSEQTSLSDNTFAKDKSQIRKLYFIHPKITPLLHNKRPTCRLPSKQEWKCQGHAGAVNRVKWNVPSYSHLFVTCSMDSYIKIWNIWSQLESCVKILPNHTKAVRNVEWSDDGRKLLSCSYDKTASVIDVEKGNSICRFDHTSFVSCGKWQPTNPSLCVTGGHNQLLAWDTRTPDIPIRTFEYKDSFGQVQDVLFLPDGSTFFSSSDLVSRDSADRNLMAWDFATGVTLSNQIYQERYTISCLKLHPSDGSLLAQSSGNYIAIFSTTRPYKMNRQRRFEGHKLLGYSLGFDITADGATVVSGSSDSKIYCYNYQTGKQFRTIQTDMDVIMDVSFHPLLPSTFACCAWDGSIQVWK